MLRIFAGQAGFSPYPGIIKKYELLVCLVDGKTGAHCPGLIFPSILDADAFVGDDDAGHLHVIGVARMVTLVEGNLECVSDIFVGDGPPKAEDSGQ